MKRNLWRLALMTVVVFLIFALYRRLTITLPAPTAFTEADRPLIIAHRGSMVLAPENTLLALQGALDLGADAIEVDVRASADGHLVVIRDETVDRTTDGSGSVSALTLAELQALDAGYRYSPDGGMTFPYRGQGERIPTLREVLTKFPNARVAIRIRQTTPPIEEMTAALIEELDAQSRVLVIAADDQTIRRFRKRSPQVATAASDDEIRSFYAWQRWGLGSLYRPLAHALVVPDQWGDVQLITAGFVAAAQAQGMKVYVETIDTPGRMRELLALSVDGIVTNRPDLMRQVMAELGYH